jgi:hypothetical protein
MTKTKEATRSSRPPWAQALDPDDRRYLAHVLVFALTGDEDYELGLDSDYERGLMLLKHLQKDLYEEIRDEVRSQEPADDDPCRGCPEHESDAVVPKLPDEGNYVAALNEYCQKARIHLPAYTYEKSGNDHTPSFTATCTAAGVTRKGHAIGTKKKAKQKAAQFVLAALIREFEGGS